MTSTKEIVARPEKKYAIDNKIISSRRNLLNPSFTAIPPPIDPIPINPANVAAARINSL